MRAFLALELSPATRGRLAEAVRVLRPKTFGVKWVDPAQIHLTLKFFAELDGPTRRDLEPAVAAAAASVAAAPFSVKGLGCFASGGRIRVLWCGVEPEGDGLAALQRGLEDALQPIGIAREDRPFRPHLTLGRMREPRRDPDLTQALEEMSAFDAGREEPRRLVLFKSTLTPSGPVHEVEAEWALGGAP